MRKIRLCGILIVLFLLSGSLFAQKTPILYMEDFRNQGKGNDSIGVILNRSLRLIVDLTRKYEVVYKGNIANYLDRINMRKVDPADVNIGFVRTNFVQMGVDEVLVGTFKPYDNGNMVEIRVTVNSLVENKVKFDKTYRSTTDADIFDTIDKIGLDVASVLVGRRLGIGMLVVNNTVREADIYIDGIKSGKDRVVQNTAIAGLKHKVEIKGRNNQVLFSREFEIQDRGVYDVTYKYDEFVEFIDESTNKQKVKKADYESYSGERYFKHGFEIVGGRTSLAWAGYYIDFENISFEVLATVLPYIPDYVYDWYAGLGVYLTFYAFRQNTAVFNCYFKLGVYDYYGLKTLTFPPQDPYAYLCVGIQLMPNWSFMPDFMKHWKIFVDIGTSQDFGIFWKNFSLPTVDKENPVRFANIGLPTISFGIKF